LIKVNLAMGDELTRKGRFMLESKDFATGCLTLIVCAILVPLFIVAFKLTLLFAIFLAIIIGIVLGITIVGRVVRLFISGK
jgi:hypothetical protein